MATSCLNEGCKLIKPIKGPHKVIQSWSAHMKGDACNGSLQMKMLLKTYGCQNKSSATGFCGTKKEVLGAPEALKLCLQATIIKFIWGYYFRETHSWRGMQSLLFGSILICRQNAGPAFCCRERLKLKKRPGWMSRRGLDLRPRLQLHMPFPPGKSASFRMEISSGKHQERWWSGE